MVALMRKMRTHGFPQRIYLNKLRRATTRLTWNPLPLSLPSPSANCRRFRLVFGSCPHVVKIANANANLEAEFTVQLRASSPDNLVQVQLLVQGDGGGVNMEDKQKWSEEG